MKITKRVKTIAVCATLACGAIAGAALGILVYQIAKAVEEKIKKTLNIKNILSKIPFIKRKVK